MCLEIKHLFLALSQSKYSGVLKFTTNNGQFLQNQLEISFNFFCIVKNIVGGSEKQKISEYWPYILNDMICDDVIILSSLFMFVLSFILDNLDVYVVSTVLICVTQCLVFSLLMLLVMLQVLSCFQLNQARLTQSYLWFPD